MVGAVLVRDGKIIAEGFHSAFGKPHAELDLLQKYEQEIRSTDTLYVNLEPCCHMNKKTPPCAQFLLGRGVKRVVFGMLDPNPKVAGKGIDLLRSEGVECIGPILLADSLRLNRGFVSLMTKGRPWITLKSARSLDRSIAHADGSPKKITSNSQDEWSHEFLRARHDAILVGVGTIIADDPRLTVRHHHVRISPHPAQHLLTKDARHPSPSSAWRGDRGEAQPWRIVLDPHATLPLTAKIVNGDMAKKTIVVREAEGAEGTEGAEELMKQGVRILLVTYQHGCFDWNDLWQQLTTPEGDFYGTSSVLVEGGRRTWENFRNAAMMDEEISLLGL